MGNPLNDGTWTYEWQAGRQLKSMTNADTGVTMEFTYNHAGLRTKKVKKVNGFLAETTEYFLNGKNVVGLTHIDHVEDVTDTMHFFYDAQGRVVQTDFNGTVYSYVHNFQGDIVGMLDSSGCLMVKYTYDAWGKNLVVEGTLANTLGRNNPFRYREYVYDEESLLYYLKDRYYSCTKLRFVSADRFLGNLESYKNAYTYCGNCCISRHDQSGQASRNIFSKIFGVVSDFFSNTVKTTAVKTWKSIGAILGGFGADAGVGLGVGGSLDMGIVQANALFRNDIININGSLGEGAEIGVMYEYNMGLSVGIPGTEDKLGGSTSLSVTRFHPIGVDGCTCSGILDYSPNCPVIEKTFLRIMF